MPERDGNRTLADYGMGRTRPRAPRLQPRHSLTAPTPVGERFIGKIGPIPARDCVGIVLTRHSEAHRIKTLRSDDGGCYAISATAFPGMERRGVRRVLVHELDTHTVYEYHVGDFDRVVPDHWLHNKRDVQRYASRGQARWVWPDHTERLYIERDVRL